MCFPYYYFNYDMSVSEYQYDSTQILACRGFKDWHNAIKSNSKKINEYLIAMELFGEKLFGYVNWKKEVLYNDNIMSDKKALLSNIWKNIHQDTFEENMNILSKILELIQDKNIYLIIPPAYKYGIQECEYIYSRNER